MVNVIEGVIELFYYVELSGIDGFGLVEGMWCGSIIFEMIFNVIIDVFWSSGDL